MVHSRAWMACVRTAWRAIDDGEFFCAACGGDRSYLLLAGRRRLTVLGVPVLPRGPAGPVVACASCHGHFPVTDRERPTTTRLTALLRDAVHAVALALLTAGGGQRAARQAAVESVRAAGFPECSEERLLTLQAALFAQGRSAPDREVREALAALTPHLAPQGRASLLLLGARVALADGPYQDGERAMLRVVGEALALPPAETERLLTAATAG